MKSMVPIYKELLDANLGLKILVYSGDDDGVCATVGTQGWIWDLAKDYKVTGREWKSYKVAGQTAGYLTTWGDVQFAFMTVHGAGHEVCILLSIHYLQTVINGLFIFNTNFLFNFIFLQKYNV